MSRKQPYSDNPFDDGISPVIDPATVYETDPEINFDNVKQSPAPQPKQGKKAEGAAPEGDSCTVPGPCPHCAESEKTRLLALADLDNARKRLVREKEEFVKFAGESILADILPALDNLDLALAYAPEHKECKNFVVGVDMTRKLLLDALAQHGLEQVGELGETFDPAKHEAVEMQEHPEYAPGKICALMNKGYRLKDRLIRPAKVKVCKKD